MTTVANPALGRVQDLFRDLVWENAVQAGLAALFIEAPWLAVWPLKPIVQGIVDAFQGKIYAALRLAIDLQAIALVNEKAQREFDKASVMLKIFERDYGLGSEEYRKARDHAKAALAEFVRYRGT